MKHIIHSGKYQRSMKSGFKDQWNSKITVCECDKDN